MPSMLAGARPDVGADAQLLVIEANDLTLLAANWSTVN